MVGGVTTTTTAQAATLVSGLGGPGGYGTNLLYYNDDGSSCSGGSGPIDITPAFPSGLTFFGMTFTQLCLNTNGNITFGGPVSTFTPRMFPVAAQRMIAPWWGDVDTRNAGAPSANGVYWDVRRGQFTATWHNVDYYLQHADMRNDFQLVLRTFEGCGIGDFDVEFRYHECNWTAGDASGGNGGHCDPGSTTCTPAQAGFDAGDSVHYYALPGSLSESIVNLCTTSNIGEPGVWRFRIRGGELPCTGSGMMCNTGLMGACADGITTCHSGTATCDQLAAPSTERCDGVDNDCNGMTDEGDMLCPTGYLCESGSCVPRCVEGGCFENQTCTASGACVDDACLSMTCPSGQRCRDGACVDACLGLHCPAPSVCRQGGCVVPCDGVVCDTGQVCENGRCQISCMCRACPDGYACSPDGTCQPGDCIGLGCAPGQVCESALTQEPGATARCIDPCEGAVCPDGQHCESGRCMPGAPPPDAGVPDAGVPDSGSNPDDASISDGASGDGSSTDGARGDGAADGGFGHTTGPCGCRIVGGTGSSKSSTLAITGALAAFAMVITRRRRRRTAK
jgi:hypothetical protein